MQIPLVYRTQLIHRVLSINGSYFVLPIFSICPEALRYRNKNLSSNHSTIGNRSSGNGTRPWPRRSDIANLVRIDSRLAAGVNSDGDAFSSFSVCHIPLLKSSFRHFLGASVSSGNWKSYLRKRMFPSGSVADTSSFFTMICLGRNFPTIIGCVHHLEHWRLRTNGVIPLPIEFTNPHF